VVFGEEPAGWWLRACEYQAGWYMERAWRLLAGQAVADVGVAVAAITAAFEAAGLDDE
jgi:hypothetical protein